MTFTTIRQHSGIIRLPILHPDDERAPQWIRDKYAGRRVVIWYEGYGPEGSIVAGGLVPPRHRVEP